MAEWNSSFLEEEATGGILSTATNTLLSAYLQFYSKMPRFSPTGNKA